MKGSGIGGWVWKKELEKNKSQLSEKFQKLFSVKGISHIFHF